MNKISWEKFIKKRRLTNKVSKEKRKVEYSGEIVTLMKSFDRIIGELEIGKDIDFIGCSPDYVIDKINLTIGSLKWMTERIKEIK